MPHPDAVIDDLAHLLARVASLRRAAVFPPKKEDGVEVSWDQFIEWMNS